MLGNTSNEPSKFGTKNWIEINDNSRGMYEEGNQIKTSMLKSSLCDYSYAYILVRGTITATELKAGRNNNNIQLVFKNCAPLTDCISEINNTKIDNAKCKCLITTIEIRL